MNNVRLIELPNGIRVVHQYAPHTRAVHCGYIIDTGSRDDRKDQAGMAHFVEHMTFKGTAKRKMFHVLNYLDSVGGDVNAYTTREKTCLYASLMQEYFERAAELLTDITFSSAFPEKEIEKEKLVIADEIDMYRDSPDEAIIDDFDQMIFPDHGLGAQILGTKESIRSFDQASMRGYIQRHYTARRVVFSVAGNVTPERMERVIRRHLLPLSLPEGSLDRHAPEKPSFRERSVGTHTEQNHEVIGGRAYALRQGHYAAFSLLNNLLGGQAMNSRLNLNIRERYGLSYNIQSFYTPYIDAGIWGVYYSSDPANMERIRNLVYKELRKLWEQPLGPVALSQAKRQLIGQLTLSHEHLLNQMLGMAKDVLDFGQIIPFGQHIAEIEALTAPLLQEAAVEIFRDSPLSLITYQAS